MNYEEWQTQNSQSIAKKLAMLRSLLRRVDGEQESAIDDVGVESEPFVSALEMIQQGFGLSDFETECLFLCAAVEYDTGISELCAVAQDTSHRTYPTPSLCMQVFYGPAWDFLSPDRPLKKYSLIEYVKQGTQPSIVCPMVADSRIVNFIRGLNHCDERLSWYLHPIAADQRGRLSESQLAIVDKAIETQDRIGSSRRPVQTVYQVTGANSDDKFVAAATIADRYGLRLRRLVVESIPSQVDDVDQLTKLWNRECRLSPVALYVDLLSDACDATVSTVATFIARLEGLVVIDVRDRINRLPGSIVEMTAPTSIEQKSAWQEQLQLESSNIAQLLSGQFELSLGTIDRIIDRLSSPPEVEVPTLATTLWDACRHECRPKLEDLAQRIDAKATWEDLVVPSDQMHLLKQISGQVRHRSKVLDDWGFRNQLNRGYGVTVLFAGESGTGKTMAAEVIANDLRLDLFRIDLSSVVNKYIGETEKNLRKLFDAADSGGAILFFDEADALFGKRSEVKDSHDRYSNIETNYLLQRLESFRGLAILASNSKSNMDSAFLRRLRFVVDFTFPEADQRKEIWRRVFPSETPLSAFDPTQLAKIGIAGGNIHNIALNAAFAAAANRDSIDMSSLLESAKSELIKAQKPLSVPGIHWPTVQEARS